MNCKILKKYSKTHIIQKLQQIVHDTIRGELKIYTDRK